MSSKDFVDWLDWKEEVVYFRLMIFGFLASHQD